MLKYRLTMGISEAEQQALEKAAEESCRDVREQARFLLREGLVWRNLLSSEPVKVEVKNEQPRQP